MGDGHAVEAVGWSERSLVWYWLCKCEYRRSRHSNGHNRTLLCCVCMSAPRPPAHAPRAGRLTATAAQWDARSLAQVLWAFGRFSFVLGGSTGAGGGGGGAGGAQSDWAQSPPPPVGAEAVAAMVEKLQVGGWLGGWVGGQHVRSACAEQAYGAHACGELCMLQIARHMRLERCECCRQYCMPSSMMHVVHVVLMSSASRWHVPHAAMAHARICCRHCRHCRHCHQGELDGGSVAEVVYAAGVMCGSAGDWQAGRLQRLVGDFAADNMTVRRAAPAGAGAGDGVVTTISM